MQPNANANLPPAIALSGDANSPAEISFLESVLENLQDGVFVYARENLRIRFVNGAGRARMGWTRDDARGKFIPDTAATFNTDAFYRAAAPLLNGEEDCITLELVHHTGPMEVSTRLIKTRDEGDFFVSVVRDITCRRSSEHAKVQTVSTVSHELRTPLTSIHGALRLLKAGVVAELDSNTQSVVDIAARNTDRLLSIVNDILDLEKIKSNKMDFSISEIDIIACLRDTVELVAASAFENDVTLDIDSDLSNAMVLGNSDRVAQVITNFASNAIKYSPEGATVRFGVRLDKGGIIISVTDRGPGISAEQNKMLFKPFSQARAGDGSKRPGTGLGLAIVAAILKRLDYPVAFQSEVGKGSTFSFRVPPHLVLWTETHESQDTGTA